MPTPTDLERHHTLLTAVARYDKLRQRDALAPPPIESDAPPPHEDDPAPLSCEEALEMLALGELIARKAGYGRQLGVRTARATGASWSQIGEVLGTSKQAAWETHSRWLDDQNTESMEPRPQR